KEADLSQVAELWRNSPFFLETLKIAISLNADKMVSRVAELHDNFSDTIFSVTQDQLQSCFGHKRSHVYEENFQEPQRKKISTKTPERKVGKGGNILPDEEDNDEDEGVPAPKDTIINNSKKWILPSGQNLPAEENTFTLEVEGGDVNGAYKLCIENHVNSEENNYIYKISKIYAELSKNKVDILDYAGDTHTELDVIMKAFGYIIEGLNPGFGTYQKWLVVGDRCRSARVNQSILNGLLNLNLTDEQAKNIKVSFVQVCGTSGQMLIEDLIEGFYVVFPGPKFEFPTRLQHIKKLKSAINIINFIMDMYEQTNKIAETQENTRNGFNDIFSDDSDIKPTHYKAKYIHKPWWSPKRFRGPYWHRGRQTTISMIGMNEAVNMLV
ncbi:15455_t:CDS:10, partial [Gigaspora rosea]